MGIYEETAVNLAKDLEEEFGKDYTLEQLLRFQAQEVGLITSKTLNDYSIQKEFEKIWLAQKDLPKKDRISNNKICIDIATRHNRSWQGIYILAKEFYPK
jgi:hypothetical protein